MSGQNMVKKLNKDGEEEGGGRLERGNKLLILNITIACINCHFQVSV